MQLLRISHFIHHFTAAGFGGSLHNFFISLAFIKAVVLFFKNASSASFPKLQIKKLKHLQMLKQIFLSSLFCALDVVAFLTGDVNYSCCLYEVLHLHQFFGDFGRKGAERMASSSSRQGGVNCMDDT